MALISCCYGAHSGALVLHLAGHCLFQAESHPNVDIGPTMNRISLTPTHPCHRLGVSTLDLCESHASVEEGYLASMELIGARP